MPKTKLIAAITITITITAFLAACNIKGKSDRAPSVFQKHPFIGHAMGGIDDVTYSNSLEAFLVGYGKGRRVFEVDFFITKDNRLVCFHQSEGMEKKMGMNKSISEYTADEFSRLKLLGGYTTLNAGQLAELMRKYPDIYIVTDTKDMFADNILMALKIEFQMRDISLMQRVIPQIYTAQDYFNAREIYPFKEIILTLYKIGAKDEDVLRFISDKPDITGITVSTGRFTEALARGVSDMGRYLFVHTINDESTMEEFRRRGAYGFYTDSYHPQGSPKRRP